MQRDIELFQQKVWEHYHTHKREMPWRDHPTPYYVLVSELMLQQTQVSRVIPKFQAFITTFPTIGALGQAPLNDVLTAWSGLGYNRRAKFLHEAAKQIDAMGAFPATVKSLEALPGIGPNTAAAILNYAFETPTVFVETNLRTVMFHEFFHDQTDIHDAQIKQLVEATLDYENPREWFWALMDYGAMLKQTYGGRLDQSRHYKKQSPLSGSVRQVRGQILRILTQHGAQDESTLRDKVAADERYDAARDGLLKDGLITRDHQTIVSLTGSERAS